MAQNKSTQPKQTVRQNASQDENWGIEAVKTIGLSLLLAFGIRTFVAEARYIPSGSMEPTLLINDRLIVDKVSYRFGEPDRGDIVVFNPTDALRSQGFKDAFIKRVIGLPGDNVEIRQGQVLINGQVLDEAYTADERSTSVETCVYSGVKNPYLEKLQTIPNEHYLVLGDNRQNSFDGRCWGLVARSDLVGRAVFRFWPIPRVGLISDQARL
ncbi:signal peptidase I [Lyngbya confervoides]|uniref:Signal peptidase I n=1 Tax=Lyngbya confervoides BDU141951 TaxID=1574623 RepID=A0ABD4T6F2_9CYAN|nr:signal peptidase I [Lyngbya confervoides]MCM1984279.1 signal peptidase I [Lyngbya confervoides BDU141951]